MENNRISFWGLPSVARVVIVAFVALIQASVATLGSAQRVAVSGPGRAPETQHVTVSVDNAPLATVLHAIATQAGLVVMFNGKLVPSTMRVTLHLRDVAAADAFQQALRGTGLIMNVHPTGDVTIVRAVETAPIAGTILGRVTAATTKQPLRGAKIGLDGAERVTETAEDGTYRLTSVTAGVHTVIIKLLGYARAVRTVDVVEGVTTTADVTLAVSTATLDQVIVTGTVNPTELRAVSNAITVITAKQIEERGITHIDQLFHGDVPGVFAQNVGSGTLLDEVSMFSRGATALSMLSAGVSSFLTNPIKTYIDGVELADPKYLSQIDPKSIERIEILTGPQASTIYGSNALNGVMQIFTKRGTTSTPQLTLNLLSGWVENNFSSARTPQHDYGAQLNGIEGRLSYNAGGSWDYMGPWTPAKQTTRTSGFGGIRFDLPTPYGPATVDMTLRRTTTQNVQRGDASQAVVGYAETGWFNYSNLTPPGISAPQVQVLGGQTLGLTLGYAPSHWWSHEFGVAQDASDTDQHTTGRQYRINGDTTLLLVQNHTDRRSLRYTTTAQVPITSFSHITVTAGADAWQSLTSLLHVNSQTLTGVLTGRTGVLRQPSHNTGAFLQAQFSFGEKLFVTPGMRVEWNPGYGSKVRVLPGRYGAAYTQEFGFMTAKIRGSYGRSTRPPQPTLKLGEKGTSFDIAYFGDVDARLPNAELGPEFQQGGEGGIELYLGTRGSLVITRYNQTVDNLIALANRVDSTPTLLSLAQLGIDPASYPQWTDGYGYLPQSEYLNIGSIRNQGWELQGSINTGPFTTRGTYSWTKSRTIGVDPRYRSLFTQRDYPQYQRGATFQYLPEHTWAFGITYARLRTSIALNVTGTGQLTSQTGAFYLRYLTGTRLPQNQLSLTAANYMSTNSAYALADLMATHQFFPKVDGVIQVQNLTNYYRNDYDAGFATLGRQAKAGLRLRLQ